MLTSESMTEDMFQYNKKLL